MALPEQQINTGLFRPTTTILDVSRLQDINVTSPEFKELLVRLYQTVSNIDIAVNLKESSLYFLEEFVTGQLWHNTADPDPNNQRQGFRKVITGTTLGAGVTNFAHGLTITSTWKLTHLYGGASDSVGMVYYPITHPLIAAHVDVTNVVVNNTTGVTFDNVEIVIEYLKF